MWVVHWKNARVFTNVLNHFRGRCNEHLIVFFLHFACAEFPKARSYQVQTVSVKPGCATGGCAPALEYFDAASNVAEDIFSVSSAVLQSTLVSDHFGLTKKQPKCFGLVSSKQGTKSSLCVGNKVLLFRLGFPTHEEKVVFCTTSSVHCSLIELTRNWTRWFYGGKQITR